MRGWEGVKSVMRPTFQLFCHVQRSFFGVGSLSQATWTSDKGIL